jgi:2-polyprenyl-6-methoxyphenol hydroxylase-like FAD-dependent oxidoreductase
LWAQVYERSEFKYEIGAAITVTPNGGHALDALGIDPKDGHPVAAGGYELVACDTLETQAFNSCEDYNQMYGHRLLCFHRVHLHDLLRRHAVMEDGKGSPARIHLGCKVKDVDCEAGIIHMEDGTSVDKDLVIIANGIKVIYRIYCYMITDEESSRDWLRLSLAMNLTSSAMEELPYEVSFRCKVFGSIQRWVPSSQNANQDFWQYMIIM